MDTETRLARLGRSARRWRLACVGLLLAGGVGAAIGAAANVGQPKGFSYSYEVRFDESLGGKRPTPQIPKGWRFLGLGNGSKINASTLWFQDEAGSLHVFHGFQIGRDFILDDSHGTLGVAP